MITTVKVTTSKEYHLHSNALREDVLECLRSLEEAETTVTIGYSAGGGERVKIIGKGQSVYVISHSARVLDQHVRCDSFEEASTVFVQKAREAAEVANR